MSCSSIGIFLPINMSLFKTHIICLRHGSIFLFGRDVVVSGIIKLLAAKKALNYLCLVIPFFKDSIAKVGSIHWVSFSDLNLVSICGNE